MEDVFVTGIGLIAGSGRDVVRQGQSADDIPLHCYNPAVAESVLRYVGKPAALRGMSSNQIQAVLAAGNALNDAGLLHQNDLLMDTDLVVCCNDGERDDALDREIIAELSARADWELEIQRYFHKLRPSHFLTVLPNLFAANISSCLNVLGESTTYLGGATGALTALDAAIFRVAAGYCERCLYVGAFYYADSLNDELKHHLVSTSQAKPAAPLPAPSGSVSAALLFESASAARRRTTEFYSKVNVSQQSQQPEPSVAPALALPSATGWHFGEATAAVDLAYTVLRRFGLPVEPESAAGEALRYSYHRTAGAFHVLLER